MRSTASWKKRRNGSRISEEGLTQLNRRRCGLKNYGRHCGCSEGATRSWLKSLAKPSVCGRFAQILHSFSGTNGGFLAKAEEPYLRDGKKPIACARRLASSHQMGRGSVARRRATGNTGTRLVLTGTLDRCKPQIPFSRFDLYVSFNQSSSFIGGQWGLFSEVFQWPLVSTLQLQSTCDHDVVPYVADHCQADNALLAQRHRSGNERRVD